MLNGFITVTGIVSDEVGIASFSSTIGNEEDIEIPLLTGNPYWSRTFDLRGEKNGLISFKAIDLSGNSEEVKLRLKPDLEGDKPLLNLIDFTDNQIFSEEETVLKGIAADDDGIKEIYYSFDGNENITMETDGPFILDIAELEPGKHTVELSAVDLFDIIGNKIKYSFYKTAENPQIQLTEYTSDKIVEPFFDGIIFMQGKTAKISGIIIGGEGDSTVSYTIGDEETKSVKASKGVFTITVSNKLEVGAYDLNLKAIDNLEREVLFNSRIYFAAAPGKDEEYNPVREDRTGMFLIDARLNNGETVNISNNFPLTGYITGDTIRTVELDPPQSNFTASKNGNQFTIVPLSQSEFSTFVLKVTTSSGKEYTSNELNIASDFTNPQLVFDDLKVSVKVEDFIIPSGIEINEEGEEVLVEESIISIENEILTSNRISDKIIVSGSLTDTSEIISAEISFSGSADSYGGAKALNLESADGKYLFNQEMDLLFLPEGEHFITITAEDSLANMVSITKSFIIDRSAPSISIISPASDIPVEGIISVSGRIDDFTGGGEVFFSSDGIDFIPVEMSSLNSFTYDIDLSIEDSDPDSYLFRVTDKGRNTRDLKPVFTVDLESDRPKVAIEVPAADSTIRSDFSVTGLVFDDDAVDKIFYSLDGKEFNEIEGNFYYNIPFSLANISDGLHTITVRAQDTGGFMSEDITTSFLISKAEPVSELLSPAIEDYIKKTIILEGETFDENGIALVFISYDNGITYNEAVIIPEVVLEEIEDSSVLEQLEEIVEEIADEEESDISEQIADEIEVSETVKTVRWRYTFDTKLPGDGTHSLLIKAVDSAGTIGISSTILNIDNTFPEIKLDSPTESDTAAGKLIIDGKVFDGTSVKSVVSELRALDGEFAGLTSEIQTDGVFRDIIDISEFTPGWYNLNITVTDFADNHISETRNLQIIPPADGESINLLFPEEGKEIYGPFVIEGQLNSTKGINRVALKIDDFIYGTVETDESGLFSFAITEGDLSNGSHILSVSSEDSEVNINSGFRNIKYKKTGPWVLVDQLVSGQFVSGRPLIKGTAGYSGFEDEKTKAVDKIEISLDNGRVFSKAKGRENWEFRLETYDLPEGENQLLIRAHFKDGSIAVTKLFVNVDETAPQIELFTPEENKKFNESVVLIGTASDENGLESVEVLIREGSKERYSVPSFIQGLYVDFHALGSTYGELGIGLSFFDDVVRLQAQIGLAPPGRFTGIVLGAKLLATIVELPFSYFFGYDWDFFSMSLAVGANFNYFSMSQDNYSFTTDGVVLGAVLLQLEFAKFEIKEWKVFNSYSFYTEGSLWFISSDIEAVVFPSLSFGARIGIF